jgi:hypothetical protein
MSRDLTNAAKATLEDLLDASGLGAVLEALSTICGEKSDHIRASYADEHLARAWAQAASSVAVCANWRSVQTVSH